MNRTMQILATGSCSTFFRKANILMKEIKLSISDKALGTLRDLVFGSMLGDNYGGCQQAWRKVIDAINDGEDTVEVITKEEKMRTKRVKNS